MFLTLFEWLTSWIGSLLSGALVMVSNALDISLSSISKTYPVLNDAYDIFVAIGTALTLIIAAVALYQFFFIRAHEGKYAERPVSIIFKVIIALALIYYGGYILEYILKLTSLSYDLFNGLRTSNLDIFSNASLSTSQDAFATNMSIVGVSSLIGDATTLDVTAAALALVLTILITFNIFKLILEVVERYLLLGVLVYTSPLIYCTVASSKTSNIFKSWCKMFGGGCILMVISAFFFRVVVSALCSINPDDGTYFLQLLMIIAMCKIAQRADTYMQQLGLGVATTGQNLLDDMLLAGKLLKGMLGHNSAAKSVLGGSGESRIGGPLGGFINGVRAGKTSLANGGSLKNAAAAFRDGFKNTMKRSAVGGAVAGGLAAASKAKGAGKVFAAAGGAVRGGAKGAASQIAQAFAPGTMNARRAAQAERRAANTAFSSAHRQASKRGSGLMSEELKERIASGRPFSAKEAESNFRRYGIAGRTGSGMTGNGELCNEAKAAGLSLNTIAKPGGKTASFVSGNNDRAVGAWMSNAAGRSNAVDIDSAVNDRDYFGAAHDSLYRSNAEYYSDYNSCRNGVMAKEDFRNKWESTINDKIEYERKSDIEAFTAANVEYPDIKAETAANASPEACESALFDTDRTLEKDDGFLNDILENAFPDIADGRMEGSVFENISVHELGKDGETDLGRAAEMDFTGRDGAKHHLRIFDETAYTGMGISEAELLDEYETDSGRRLYFDADGE